MNQPRQETLIEHWEAIFRPLVEKDRDHLRCILLGLLGSLAYKKPNLFDRIDEIVSVFQSEHDYPHRTWSD